MHTHLWSCCIGMLCLPLFLHSQNLTKKEEKIVSAVEAQWPQAEALLTKVVNIPSGTMNHEGIREVGAVFEEEFAALGLEVYWEELPDSLERAGHLWAKSKGKKGRKVLLIGHLDTVFEEEAGGFRRDGDKAYGPGSADMKGGDVVILYALKALKEAGALKNRQITVVFTGDEEKPGRPISVSRASLIKAGLEAEVALGFETGREGRAVVARRSSSEWVLTTTGVRAHSSGIFRERVGSGAIFEASRILYQFHEQLTGEPYLTFNPGVIMGGTEINYDQPNSRGEVFGKTNVVAQTAIVDGGIRCISEAQLTKAKAAMERIVSEGNLPGTTAGITFSDGYPPMSPKPENEELLSMYDRVSQDLGFEEIKAFDPASRGAADISFAAKVPALGGLGAYGQGAHTPNEYVNVSSLPIAIQRAAVLIHRLTR